MDMICDVCHKETNHTYYEDGKKLCMQCHSKKLSDCFACEKCGSIDSPSNWISGTLIGNLCYTCSFWQARVYEKDDDRTVRINGVHYQIGIESAHGFRGFGGRQYKIKFPEGRIVTTTNLWTQGEIPEIWKDQLPDNAEFIT